MPPSVNRTSLPMSRRWRTRFTFWPLAVKLKASSAVRLNRSDRLWKCAIWDSQVFSGAFTVFANACRCWM
jgi:hypothetical protein